MNGRSMANPTAAGARFDPPSRSPLELHQRLPGYRETPLIRAPAIAGELGIAELWVKDESDRFGLPSFKGLGASWAVYRALEARLGAPLARWSTVEELADRVSELRPLRLAAATDGNHGRAVAWMARQLGFACRIFVPEGTADARIEAIQGEAADVVVVEGSYDDAVRRSAEEAGDRCLVISDTAWPGYEDPPRWVIEGYSTMFWEVEDQIERDAIPGFDVVAVQVGVGALAASVVRHFKRSDVERPPVIVAVEPEGAACVFASMRAGGIATLPGRQESIMAGLNCGTPSPIAWPVVSTGIDLFLTIEDERAEDAMRTLGIAGIESGESGAAGLAGLRAVLEARTSIEDLPEPFRDPSGIRALVISTEGATDPEGYRRALSRSEVTREGRGDS